MARRPAKFLIDECLSPSLAGHLQRRGFVCEHVNDVKTRQSRSKIGDPVVSQYAIDRDMIVATRNIHDFEAIYAKREMHPGLILLDCPESVVFTKEIQLTMLLDAIASIEQDEPIQTVVRVIVLEKKPDRLRLTVERYFLPK